MPTIHHPDLAEVPLTTLLAALADETRLNIVRQLHSGERCCGDMDVRTSKSGLSHHMKVLRQAGVIRQRPEGTQRMTSLRLDELEASYPGLLKSVLVGADRYPGAERPVHRNGSAPSLVNGHA